MRKSGSPTAAPDFLTASAGMDSRVEHDRRSSEQARAPHLLDHPRIERTRLGDRMRGRYRPHRLAHAPTATDYSARFAVAQLRPGNVGGRERGFLRRLSGQGVMERTSSARPRQRTRRCSTRRHVSLAGLRIQHADAEWRQVDDCATFKLGSATVVSWFPAGEMSRSPALPFEWNRTRGGKVPSLVHLREPARFGLGCRTGYR
jgi:hypothetical protein